MDIVPELAEKFGTYQSTHKLNNHMNKLQHLVEISLLIQKQLPFIYRYLVCSHVHVPIPTGIKNCDELSLARAEKNKDKWTTQCMLHFPPPFHHSLSH